MALDPREPETGGGSTPSLEPTPSPKKTSAFTKLVLAALAVVVVAIFLTQCVGQGA